MLQSITFFGLWTLASRALATRTVLRRLSCSNSKPSPTHPAESSLRWLCVFASSKYCQAHVLFGSIEATQVPEHDRSRPSSSRLRRHMKTSPHSRERAIITTEKCGGVWDAIELKLLCYLSTVGVGTDLSRQPTFVDVFVVVL